MLRPRRRRGTAEGRVSVVHEGAHPLTTRVELRRFADVQAALHAPELVVPGTPDPAHQIAHHTANHTVHDAVLEALPFERVQRAHPQLLARASRLLLALPPDTPCCFVHTVARPWAEQVTAELLALPADTLAACLPLAAVLFESAAHSANGATTPHAHAAALALAQQLSQPGGHHLPVAAAVQSVVALTHSLPALLSGAVHALLAHSAEYAWLRDHGAQGCSPAAHELLRFASPSRVVYRTARQSLRLGDLHIEAGALVVLHLAHANRDPARFEHADTLSLAAGRAGHVTFGAGAHYCSGAAIVRALLSTFLEALATTPVELVWPAPQEVEWLDGVALRAPSRLMLTAATTR